MIFGKNVIDNTTRSPHCHPVLPPVFDHLQYANTAGSGIILGRRLLPVWVGFSLHRSPLPFPYPLHTLVSSSTPSPSSPQQPLRAQSPNCSRSFLRDVTNDLNVSHGKKRVFNLSSAPGNNTGRGGVRGMGRGRGNKTKVSPLAMTMC